jgi:hypothetical protein
MRAGGRQLTEYLGYIVQKLYAAAGGRSCAILIPKCLPQFTLGGAHLFVDRQTHLNVVG